MESGKVWFGWNDQQRNAFADQTVDGFLPGSDF
jgi:hypothetical protein